ncbi:Crp/Fnr family transcriptional regulator [Solirubrobacter pauli]|uniref:Crp/Fnr family transcriptional regulator n=1 Tax=Solirubrobacter pauli TaxID=166793 RepID=UPI0011C424A9|nr:Crp/Fnr family transcriptional regulator [Solirubrobacter pauli]
MPSAPTVEVATAYGNARRRTGIRLIASHEAPLGPLLGVAGDAARQQLVGRTVWLDRGRWTVPGDGVSTGFEGWLGLLILDGLVVRHVYAGGMRSCELLGPGDVLQPWSEGGEPGTVDVFGGWRVLEPTRIALLDAAFARRADRWPSITGELMRRSLARSQALAVLLALAHARRADVRLRALFWHLADRWGRMTPEGAVLSLTLTHSLIAQLTGLRRPSVSVTLADLERSGEIRRVDRSTWLIADRR